MKNIAISDETHQEMLRDAKGLSNMKLIHLVEVYRRGWQMLTPEQRHAAITNAPAAAEPTVEPAANPMVATTQMNKAAANLVDTVAEAQADGVIDRHDAQRVRASAREVQRGLSKVVAAVK
jgi:uncharacterized membrane protein YebE (DUF533 family)